MHALAQLSRRRIGYVGKSFLVSSIEDDEVVQDVKQSGFVADLTEFSEQEIIACIGM